MRKTSETISEATKKHARPPVPRRVLTDIFRLPRRATAPNAARDTRELARETTRVTAARAGTSHPGLHPDFAIGSTSVSAPQSARRLPTQHPKMLTRVARACAAREAAALRPAVLESARGQFGMCTEAFVGFSGARPDPATDAVPRDGAESTSDYPASARPRDASSSASRLSAGPWTAAASPPSDTNARADIWRARVGGSGIDGFDRAWRKPRDSRGYAAETRREDWERLRGAGEVINPCNSPKHPAAVAGIPLSGEPPTEHSGELRQTLAVFRVRQRALRGARAQVSPGG